MISGNELPRYLQKIGQLDNFLKLWEKIINIIVVIIMAN